MLRLCFILGKSESELWASTPASGIARMLAYLDIEPPERIAWEQTAMIAATVAQCAGVKNVNLEQFMPRFEKVEQTERDIFSKLRLLNEDPDSG